MNFQIVKHGGGFAGTTNYSLRVSIKLTDSAMESHKGEELEKAKVIARTIIEYYFPDEDVDIDSVYVLNNTTL